MARGEPDTLKIPDRLHSLDALRGVAALSVVFWHWQHFFFEGPAPAPSFRIEAQPLFGVFFLLYRRGILAVDLFFALSGFIFFWLYSRPIAEGRVKAFDFAVLRFSRLYPLHLLTLLLVALGQLNYKRLGGHPFIYTENDLYHFVLNLGMASSIGLERGFSFNAPFWSVSVEVLLYAIFFLLCRWVGPRLFAMIALSLLGFTVLPALYLPAARGLSSFFLGGLVHRLYLAIAASRRARALSKAITVLAVVLWAGTFLFSRRDMSLAPLFGRFSEDFPTVVLFPVTILALALGETAGSRLGARLSVLGDLSYSSYLWHFPLQLALATAARAAGIGAQAFTSPLMLLAFFALLIPVSLASHHYFEAPGQKLLRRSWLPAHSPKKPAAARSEAA
jgi:peptidoglycan/LPS O-acetylase OafA/YrhL